jgi:hypothetical protein
VYLAENNEPSKVFKPFSRDLRTCKASDSEPIANLQDETSGQLDKSPEQKFPAKAPPDNFAPRPQPVTARLAGFTEEFRNPHASETNARISIEADKPSGTHDTPQAEHVPKNPLVRPPSPRMNKDEIPSARVDKPKPAVPPSNVARSAAPETMVARSLSPYAGPFATRAVRPPIASRSEGARSAEALAAAESPETSVQISIGRVEVRAVFPEQPARRSSPAPSRPTVSLDDYLNQRHGGRR